MPKAGGKKEKPKGETALMKQWREAKRAHPEALLLFRMGDFYETFEDDAKIASEVLGIALTKRSNKGRAEGKGPASDIPLAGFPYHSLDAYLHKLLTAGHRVAICEQVEDPKEAKGIVKREVIEVVTPGTAMAEQFLELGENNYICGLLMGDARTGLALLDNSTGEFLVTEIDTPDLGDTLHRYKPSEILVADQQHEDLRYLLASTAALITPFQDWIGEIDNATDELCTHFDTGSLKGFGVEKLPLAVGAAGAVIHYLYQNHPGPKPHISALRTIHSATTMVLDDFTVRNLELFTSLATQGDHGTLISIIDQTRTGPGARMLKRWLRAPLLDAKKIDERLDRVQALAENGDLRDDIRRHLASISDMERILSRISTGKASPRDVVNLAASLETLGSVVELVTASQDRPIGKLLQQLQSTAAVVTNIRSTVVAEPPIALGRGPVIVAGLNSDLDALRDLAGSGKQWMADLQESERQRTGISSLKIGYNNVFGYYLEVTKIHQSKVPENYIRKQTLVNAERYITPDLKEQEENLLSAEEKIDTLEREIFAALLTDIIGATAAIQNNAQVLAQLDIAAGLAEVAVRQHYVRPELHAGTDLAIIGGRHPVVETLLQTGDRFTANDLHMNRNDSQIHIITGPNMAGKSTYLRQVGLIVVMAHMGSYVPADEATIGLVDRLFTRVGASDNLAGGESTFLVEMVETANILNNATQRSLILLDEIGRGTSTYDGLSIAWAVTEYLHQQSDVAGKTLFATHYHELVALADTLPRVRNFNVAVREHGQEVIFLRKIVPGGADRSYGIHVAKMAGLPNWIIERAGEILNGLTSGEKSSPQISSTPDPAPQIDLFAARESALSDEFDRIQVENLTPIEALNLLDSLKKKHGL